MPWLKNWFKHTLGIAFELSVKDIVVFMVGPSGGGKSWFITAVTNSEHVKASQDLRPSTKEVQAIRCELTDEARTALRASEQQKYIVFVDMPSFLTNTLDERAEENTSQWLREARSKSTLVGTIYIDRVANVNVTKAASIQEYLDCFARTFPGPQEFHFPVPLRLRGILSYDSQECRIKENEITSRRDEFQQRFGNVGPSRFSGGRKLDWGASFHAQCLRRDNEEEAWNAVVALFS